MVGVVGSNPIEPTNAYRTRMNSAKALAGERLHPRSSSSGAGRASAVPAGRQVFRHPSFFAVSFGMVRGRIGAHQHASRFPSFTFAACGDPRPARHASPLPATPPRRTLRRARPVFAAESAATAADPRRQRRDPPPSDHRMAAARASAHVARPSARADAAARVPPDDHAHADLSACRPSASALRGASSAASGKRAVSVACGLSSSA